MRSTSASSPSTPVAEGDESIEQPPSRRLGRRGRACAKAGALAVVLALATTTLAGAINGESTGRRYTGCLTTNGNLVQIKAGDSPKVACASGQTKVTLGNGDITGLTPGLGLVGGGDQGTVGLGLSSNYALPQGCGTGAPAKRSSNGWYCGTDYGAFSKTVGGLTIDTSTSHLDGWCPGDATGPLSYIPPTAHVTKSSTSFTLPTGTYLPTMLASSQWFVNRTYDMHDGEQFTRGYVKLELRRTRSGVTTTVASWARGHSENSDGANLPYNQDPGVFTALSGDTYQLVATGWADYCSRSRLLNTGMDFTRIG